VKITANFPNASLKGVIFSADLGSSSKYLSEKLED